MPNTVATLPHGRLLHMVADVVASYLVRNLVAPDDLPRLIGSVFSALTAPDGARPEEAPSRPEPAVPIKKSVTPEFIICLEDGKKLKMLKRHLSTAYGLTPDQYRQRWGLAPDYPMVAPNYAAQRSVLAKQIGLGARPKVEPAPPPARARAASRRGNTA